MHVQRHACALIPRVFPAVFLVVHAQSDAVRKSAAATIVFLLQLGCVSICVKNLSRFNLWPNNTFVNSCNILSFLIILY